MVLINFQEKLLSNLTGRTRSGGLLFSLYIDIFANETSDIDLRKDMSEELISIVSSMQYSYIPEKSDAKHLTFLDCSTFEVVYNEEIIVTGCKYVNGEFESYTVGKKLRN